MTIQLQDGKRYLTADGRVVQIAGVTRDYPHLVWSYNGDWYERATGYYVRGPEQVYPNSYRTIVSEAEQEAA